MLARMLFRCSLINAAQNSFQGSRGDAQAVGKVRRGARNLQVEPGEGRTMAPFAKRHFQVASRVEYVVRKAPNR